MYVCGYGSATWGSPLQAYAGGTNDALVAKLNGRVDFGSNFDTIVNTNDTGQGSLRQFITNANTLGGDASLNQSGLVANRENAIFMISNGTAAAGLRAANDYFAGGAATIVPASALPVLATTMVLDARKQPGWTSAPIIEIDGGSIFAAADGLTLQAARNVISANGTGISITNSDTTAILGNFIGTDQSGLLDLGNSQDGISILSDASDNTVGGTASGSRNIISGNGSQGIMLDGPNTTGNLVLGNYIGVDSTGTSGLPNDHDGIIVSGNAHGNTIGGTAGGAGNIIAYNKRDGVFLTGSTTDANAILGNATFANTGLGIDLGSDGVTANDGAKTAGQPNELMDFPVFTSAVLSGTTLTLAGYVGSAPGQAAFANARVEIFESDNDATGNGEGRDPGSARLDASVRDSLDASLEYQSGTMKVDASLAGRVAPACTQAEKTTIFNTVNGAAVRTETVDGDVVSYNPGTKIINAGNQEAGNAQLDIPGDSVWALLFTVKIQ